jgi:hypothetical protein
MFAVHPKPANKGGTTICPASLLVLILCGRYVSEQKVVQMYFNFVEEPRCRSCLNVRIGFYPAGIHRLVDNRLIAPETFFFNYKYSYLWTYDLYSPVHNALEAGKSITWASWRGFGPWKS